MNFAGTATTDFVSLAKRPEHRKRAALIRPHGRRIYLRWPRRRMCNGDAKQASTQLVADFAGAKAVVKDGTSRVPIIKSSSK
jgi:hypothetical protein